ncbi:glycosyltransferase family 2 protein [Enterococcus sp. CWB-B31]|uniref:glycosyltransferase family 2 protein n=1 Tax=Enterococcus sp. CWB-B31 TaxID=2885159 RepID=UPI001E45B9DC|nr:glycosyltransferase family 2 protein [Enterococcus sp. CWB-B31]MCB5956208.1 glycosyltransferase family 2 protein [Enterococcus sp. CWB-B31]
MDNSFWIRNDRFHLKDSSKYIIDAWLEADQTISIKLDDELLEYTFEKSNEFQKDTIGQFVKIVVAFPEALENYHSLKIYSGDKGKEILRYEMSISSILEKKEPIKVCYDKKAVDFEKKTCEIEGWVVSSRPVEILLVDEKNKPILYEIEWVKRRDVLSIYSEYDVSDNNGFIIRFHYGSSKKVRLIFQMETSQVNEMIYLTKTYYQRKKMQELMKKAIKVLRTEGFGRFFKAVIRKFKHKVGSDVPKVVNYQEWIQRHLPNEQELSRQKANKFNTRPLISIVIPLYRTSEFYLNQLIDSIRAQTYDNWELCLSDGSGENSPIRAMLEVFEKSDERIKVVHNERQLHISENTNEAIKIATGNYIAFADHDDVLTPNALFENVLLINNAPDAEVIYSDEDKVNDEGLYVQPHFKPDFSIDLLCSVNYICHFLVVKRSIIDKVGLLRSEFDGAQDHDFILRCVEKTAHIYHIPKILYHWRISEDSTSENPESKRYAIDAGKLAVQEHYNRMGIAATVEDGEYFGLYRTRLIRDHDPLISIIIPNKDHVDDLRLCIDSIDEKSTYKNLEYIIIENNSTEDATFSYYEQLKKHNPRVKVVTYEGSFNYSAINNYGASFATGDYFLFMNNDVEIINPETIEELLNYAMREDVGIVGSRLYYPDGTIQHAGVVVGLGGVAAHSFANHVPGDTGYFHRIIVTQNCSAVTAACMMVNRNDFEQVGGFSEKLAVAFNDIDFCLKIRSLGKLIVYNPHAELYHYESKSRGLEDTPEKVARFQNEIAVFQEKWADILESGDPYYNVNLSLDTQDFALKAI